LIVSWGFCFLFFSILWCSHAGDHSQLTRGISQNLATLVHFFHKSSFEVTLDTFLSPSCENSTKTFLIKNVGWYVSWKEEKFKILNFWFYAGGGRTFQIFGVQETKGLCSHSLTLFLFVLYLKVTFSCSHVFLNHICVLNRSMIILSVFLMMFLLFFVFIAHAFIDLVVELLQCLSPFELVFHIELIMLYMSTILI
jgi:hypothetical protein